MQFFFLLRRDDRESARQNGRKNRRASNEGHRGGGGWRYAAEVEVGPKRAPRWRLSKESSTLPRRRGRSPSGLDPFFNCIQKDRRPEKRKTRSLWYTAASCADDYQDSTEIARRIRCVTRHVRLYDACRDEMQNTHAKVAYIATTDYFITEKPSVLIKR